jgi:predicted nucleic acid-binding protein
MKHVFVETNWVVGVASPVHHRVPDALDLLERAGRGELQLHLPSICITEARRTIPTRFQPRHEADAIRKFLSSPRPGSITDTDAQTVRRVLSMYEQQVKRELKQLEETLQSLLKQPGLEVFPLNERMLKYEVELSPLELGLHSFDHAVLASVLGRADELKAAGEAELAFCELDSDLQPWDKEGRAKQPLASLYDERWIWVYGNFTLTHPKRPPDWPL